jgi:integrase
MVWRRSEDVGIGRVHPHQLRHSFAHRWLAAGGSELDLQRLAGWKSPAIRAATMGRSEKEVDPDGILDPAERPRRAE